MSQTSANANIQAWSRHFETGAIDAEGHSVEWSPWNTNTSTAVELYSNEPYDKIAYRIDASQAAGNTLDGIVLLLRYLFDYGELEPSTFTLAYSVYTTDPTAGSAAPITSGTVACNQSQTQIRISERLQTGIENAPATLYVVISEYYAYSGRYLTGYFTPDSCTVTYTVPEPTPGGNPPVVGTPTFTLTQPTAQLATDFPNTWISGISKCTVRAAVTADGTISRVYFTYGNSGQVTMTLENGVYVGTTPGGVTDGTVFTVTAISGGLTGSNSATLTGVKPYVDPSVQVADIMRCEQNGTRNDAGHYYKLKILITCSLVAEGNEIDELYAQVQGTSTTSNLSTGEAWQGPFGYLSDENSVYVIVVTIKDKIGHQSQTTVSINGLLRDVVMKRDTVNNVTHLGVGISPNTSAGDGHTSIQLPVGAKIIVGGKDITEWLRQQIGGTW